MRISCVVGTVSWSTALDVCRSSRTRVRGREKSIGYLPEHCRRPPPSTPSMNGQARSKETRAFVERPCPRQAFVARRDTKPRSLGDRHLARVEERGAACRPRYRFSSAGTSWRVDRRRPRGRRTRTVPDGRAGGDSHARDAERRGLAGAGSARSRADDLGRLRLVGGGRAGHGPLRSSPSNIG